MVSQDGISITGLSHVDQQVVQQRQPVIQTHLLRWLPVDHPCCTEVGMGQVPAELAAWFTAFERTITRYDALEQDPSDRETYRAGLRDWYDNYLIPLAKGLHLLVQAEAAICRTCWRQGLFDMPDPDTGKLVRPVFDEVLAKVRSVLKDAPHKTSVKTEHSRVAQLQERELCRSEACAEQVADALRTDTIEHDAAGMARGLLLSYFQHKQLGLLLHSSCPYLNALFLLEQQKQFVASDELLSDDLWATLRADLIAFYQAAQSVHPKLWNERLLHEPANTPTRQHYQQKHLWRNQRARFIVALQQQRDCDEAEATRLLDILAQEGLPALIDWRRGAETTRTRETWEQRPLQKRLDHHLSVLADEDRQAIETTLQHLVVAMKETGLPLPLAMLIDDYPSSRRRRRLGRRFWFGLANILHRRESRRHQRQQRYRSRVSQRTQQTNQNTSPDADCLVAAFARLADLDVRDARALIRDFITYGLLGLLPRTVRVHAIYQPLVSWLALIKWGRLPGSVPWLEVVEQINTYREHLGLPGSFSPQLTRSIFNGIAKPAYWHGGQGEAVARVRQRATMTADEIPRLHRTWLLVHILLPLPFCTPGGIQARDNTHLLLVCDQESELPMGGAVSPDLPGEREVCLALYQAIWHPGGQNWPLHGIPETLQVPQGLAVNGLDNLYKAASYLLMEIDTRRKQPQNGLQKIKAMLKVIRTEGVAYLTETLPPDERTGGPITNTLLTWLGERYFSDHTPAPIWESVRRYGVNMRGHDTPAAGWLLPVVGDAETTAQSVIYQGEQYSSPYVVFEPEQRLPVRGYPYYYPQRDSGIFVQTGTGSATRVQYLPWQN